MISPQQEFGQSQPASCRKGALPLFNTNVNKKDQENKPGNGLFLLNSETAHKEKEIEKRTTN